MGLLNLDELIFAINIFSNYLLITCYVPDMQSVLIIQWSTKEACYLPSWTLNNKQDMINYEKCYEE